MTHRAALFALLTIIGCSGEGTETDEDQIDTADTDEDDSGDDVVEDNCDVLTLAETDPLHNEIGWFYRDTATFTFTDDASQQAIFSASNAGGDIAMDASFDESGFNATVMPSSGEWVPNATYTLTASFCERTADVVFTTDSYGTPLSVEPADLTGNTYLIDLAGARYSEPAGIGAVIRLFLTDPIILGVETATADELALIGAQGRVVGSTGEVVQRKIENYPIFDFGVADFTAQPYFRATSTQTVFSFEGEDVVVHDFQIEGTFSSDGEIIGGASFTGLGDLRNLGKLLDLGDDPGAACEYLAALTIECEACPGGEEYCMTLTGTVDDAQRLDLTLETEPPEAE